MRKKGPAADGRNGKRKIGLLSAVLLAAVLIVTTVQLSGADPLKLVDGNCSLTVNPCGPDSEFLEDLSKVEVQVSLYQVALAQKIEGYDTYGYLLNDNFRDSKVLSDALAEDKLSELTTEKWVELAAEAARIVGEKAIEPTAVATALGSERVKAEGLDAGLYLLIVADDSVKTEKYVYTFRPELVSIPGKQDGSGWTTGGDGDWIYDMTVNLKPERVPRNGSLVIRKTLNVTDPTVMREPVTLVFRVKAVLDGEVVYDDVVGMTFHDGGNQEVRIEGIPVGAVVTVTEVYSGASFTIVGSDTQEGVITADKELLMTFENTDEEHRSGHGVVNSFEYDSENGWKWTQDPVQP